MPNEMMPPQGAMPPMPPQGPVGSEMPPTAPDQAGMGMPQPPMAEAPKTEADINGLKDKFDRLQTMNNSIDSGMIESKNNLSEFRGQLLKSIFDSMIKFGVDPSNEQSVSEFLNKLYDFDPDLYSLFEMAFVSLTEGTPMNFEGSAPQQGQEPAAPQMEAPMPMDGMMPPAGEQPVDTKTAPESGKVDTKKFKNLKLKK